jgi:ketosteroid isomerase-like protein
MSEENVEIVRAMFEQFAHGDFSGLADLADEFERVSQSRTSRRGHISRRGRETVDSGVSGVL